MMPKTARARHDPWSGGYEACPFGHRTVTWYSVVEPLTSLATATMGRDAPRKIVRSTYPRGGYRDRAGRDARVPVRGTPAAAVDDSLGVLEQGHLSAGADLERVRRARQAPVGGVPRQRAGRRHDGSSRRAVDGPGGTHAHRAG